MISAIPSPVQERLNQPVRPSTTYSVTPPSGFATTGMPLDTISSPVYPRASSQTDGISPTSGSSSSSSSRSRG